jgi:hypothetical protein
MKYTVVCLSSFLFIALLPGVARSQDPSASSSSSPKPNIAPASGQSSPEDKAKTPAEKSGDAVEKTSAPAERKKPKKVWTNDEIGSVKGSISVVGDDDPSVGDNATRKPVTNASGYRERLIENYRNQIEQLNAQIDAIDKRIAQLKNFKGENSSPSGGININQGYNMVPVEDQVKQLEEKKKQLQAGIENVENDARKNGVEPGDLR